MRAQGVRGAQISPSSVQNRFEQSRVIQRFGKYVLFAMLTLETFGKEGRDE